MTDTAAKNGSAAKGPPARDAGLTDVGKLRMAQIRAVNTMVGLIAKETWGKKLHPQVLRATAEYCRRFRLAPHEIHILGGNIYRNGPYYYRRFAELAREGRILDFRGRHIGPDDRLDRLAAIENEWALTELTEREQLRIIHAVPANADFAYLAEALVDGIPTPITGVKFIIIGRTKKVKKWGERKGEFLGWEDVEADPVGNENPIETVETRAWHRCGMKAAAEIPELREEQAEMDAAGVDMMEGVATIITKEEQATSEARPAQPVPIVMLTEGPAPDFTAAQRAQAAKIAETEDPYRTEVTEKGRAALRDYQGNAAPPPSTAAPLSYECEACGFTGRHAEHCPYNTDVE